MDIDSILQLILYGLSGFAVWYLFNQRVKAKKEKREFEKKIKRF